MGIHYSSWLVRGLVIAFAFMLTLSHRTPANSDDHVFLEHLLQRRLSRLGEVLCREHLAASTLSPRERAIWTVDLIRCQTDHALLATADEREAVWEQARRTAAEFTREHSSNPRRILVQLQDALTVLMQGELVRQEEESPAASPHESVSREKLREAILLLEAMDKFLTAEIPVARRRTNVTDGLDAVALASLQYHVWYHLLRARRIQAMCYSDGSADRAASATQAIAFAKRALAQLPSDEPLSAQIRIELGDCLRLLGDYPGARAAFEPLPGLTLTPETQALLGITAARVELAAGDTSAALRILSSTPSAPGLKAERAWMQLEILIAQWRDARRQADKQATKSWQSAVRQFVQEMETNHGAYWGRRAERLFLAAAKELGAEHDWDLLRRSADQLFLQGQLDQAIAAYDAAAAKARAEGDAVAEFDLGYKAAAILQSRSSHDETQQRLRQLARRHPQLPLASEAHLLAAWNLAQLVRQDSRRLSDYRAVLEEHLDAWSDQKTAHTARFWLGNLLRQMRLWREAADAYRGIGEESPDYPQAVEAAVECYVESLNQLAREKKSLADALDAALSYCESIYRVDNELPRTWSSAQRGAVIGDARIRASFGSQGFESTEAALIAALPSFPMGGETTGGEANPAEEAQRRRALRLLVVLQAAQPSRFANAQSQLEKIGPMPADEWSELLELLEHVGGSADDAARKNIAEVQLLAIEQCGQNAVPFSPEQVERQQRMRANAHAAAGDIVEAIRLWSQLAQAHPNDGRVQERYGELLLRATDPESASRALDQWRRIAARLEAGSDRWLRAKLSVAEAQFRLNQRAEAAKLIRYLEATGAFDKSELKEAFLTLLKRCEG